MEEPRRIDLPFSAPLVCELVAVVRDHHDSMAGPARDRPGWDRVRLRLPSGEEIVADLWTRSGQSIVPAPKRIEVRDDGETVVWDSAEDGAHSPSTAPANDDAERRRLSRAG